MFSKNTLKNHLRQCEIQTMSVHTRFKGRRKKQRGFAPASEPTPSHSCTFSNFDSFYRCLYSRGHVLLVGTMKAAVELVRQCNAKIVECMFVIELTDLGGRNKVDAPSWSLMSF